MMGNVACIDFSWDQILVGSSGCESRGLGVSFHVVSSRLEFHASEDFIKQQLCFREIAWATIQMVFAHIYQGNGNVGFVFLLPGEKAKRVWRCAFQLWQVFLNP